MRWKNASISEFDLSTLVASSSTGLVHLNERKGLVVFPKLAFVNRTLRNSKI